MISQQLDTDTPTRRHLARHMLLQCTSTKHWKVFVADVKSALLQAGDIVDEYTLRIFGVRNANIGKRPERIMGLGRDEIFQMRNPRSVTSEHRESGTKLQTNQ